SAGTPGIWRRPCARPLAACTAQKPAEMRPPRKPGWQSSRLTIATWPTSGRLHKTLNLPIFIGAPGRYLPGAPFFVPAWVLGRVRGSIYVVLFHLMRRADLSDTLWRRVPIVSRHMCWLYSHVNGCIAGDRVGRIL